MLNKNERGLDKLLRMSMTRKQFVTFSMLTVGSVFGLIGLIKQLTSHAATATSTVEPEDNSNTISGNATVVADSSASQGGAVKFGSGGTGGGAGSVAHGSLLTLDMVGPWVLQGVAKGSETLTTLSSSQLSARISTYPGNARPSYIPGTPYVYNNSPTNHGGIVPAGGMTIDGYFVPAGTWVVQFYDMSASSIIIEGNVSGAGSAFPGVMFRGCRMRGKYSAPGWFNQNGQSVGGIIWINYCDAGGSVNSVNPADMCESIFESKGNGSNDRLYVIRNYLSIATTLVFLRNGGDAAIENFCEKVTDFGDHTKHLNGIGNSGNQTATLWLRNHMYIPPQAGSTQLTDLIQMAADDGAYPGTGTNLDGSTGYRIDSNYLAGAAYCLQLGVDKSNTASTVKNVQVVNNRVSTNLYTHGGSSGLGYKGPAWGTLGNTFSNNTWVDGGNGVASGTLIASSEVAPGP